MPELPDVTVYVEALATRVLGQRLERVTIANPFLLRSFEPSPQELAGRRRREVRRLGKRIAIGLEGDLWLVLHLMIAGRLHWYAGGQRAQAAPALATFDFDNGTLTLTEAGTKRRASLHVVRGRRGARRARSRRPRGRSTRLPRSSPRASPRRITRSSAR